VRQTWLVLRRELAAYLKSPLGAIVIAAALLIDGIYFQAKGLGGGKRLSSDVLITFFDAASGTTMVASIVLAMRLVAGERETGTLVLLNTAPIRDREIILGKFGAAYALLALKNALSLYMPLLVMVNGKINKGHVAVGYLGIFLLAGAALAIGLFASTLARTQVVAVIVGAVVLATFVLLWLVAKVTEPPVSDFLDSLALHHDNQRPFMQGKLVATHVAYYVAVTFFFLLAATKVMEARRWR
jgi:ABC-2 type transport system permease protein